MSKEEIEQKFGSAGWDLDGSFEDHLVIGYSDEGGLSMLAHKESWGTGDPLFELIDHESMSTYWVREVPTPEQALRLLPQE
jgi:hypothetical protein